ncbi:MAG: hypothetical protein E7623_00215 [Ruminococcaceae bacterium]|nr:hypothetical protein [Oscillospiraceae bacterium]
MFTYVINTSENRTFESDKLFDLAGYNKICWKNCSLDRINECAKEIAERQNVLVSEDFTVAIIVDFFGFDRIRAPYGRKGFGKEEGVDLSMYPPYIEAYIADNLISYLEKYELFAEGYEVYYVQSEKFERYEFLNNAKEQLRYILKGKEQTALRDDEAEALAVEKALDELKRNEGLSSEELELEEKRIRLEAEEDTVRYETFTLYCTPELSLDLNVADYPYGSADKRLSFSQFFKSFGERAGMISKIRHNYYLTTYGGGPIRAAFDTLCLSLYLVYVYEREENISDKEGLEIAHIDSAALKDVLQSSWSKITVARAIAAENQSEYFSLRQNNEEISKDLERRKKTSEETSVLKEKLELEKSAEYKKVSPAVMYGKVNDLANKTDLELDAEKRNEIDKLMREYLTKRDETNEHNVEADFEELKKLGALDMTPQCPSKEEYNYNVGLKEKEISDLFEKVLAAEYINVDYSEEKEECSRAFKKYSEIKAAMNKNFFGDLIFLIISVLIAVVPYEFLQLSYSNLFVFGIKTLRLATAALFAGAFLLSFVIHVAVYARRLSAQKKIIRECYLNAVAKERYAFSALRDKYKKDLIRIEEARYEIRQIKHLYEINIKKDKNVTLHRNLLEEIQDKISSMLSNLEVEPILDPNESVQGEFDLTKSFKAKDNKIYQIFSIETIEDMFRKRGSDKE